MNIKEFNDILLSNIKEIDVNISNDKINLFYNYMNLILSWNEKINLTAITEEKDIIVKHFIDSMSIDKYVKENNIVMDMGTGAGFPGIPLKIINDNQKFILIDSLNKRIKFLEEVKKELRLDRKSVV